jgi:hypothetical protein
MMSLPRGLTIMLDRRGRDSRVDTQHASKTSMTYVMKDGQVIICFPKSVKKSELMTLGDITRTALITGPTISKQSLSYIHSVSGEFVASWIYSFDRLQSVLVPNYTKMDEASIARFEDLHKCPRGNWPCIRSDDPLVQYLGFRPGMCLQTTMGGFYRQSVRYVVPATGI